MPRKKSAAQDQGLGTIKLDQMNQALVDIANDQRIDNQTVKRMLEEVMLKAYKDDWCQANGFPASNAQDLLAEIEIDWQNGTITLYDCKRVVPTDDDIQDDFTEIDLESAREVAPEIQAGDILREKVNPESLSKTYIRKVVSYFHQRMKEKGKEILLDTYASRIGHNITGVVTHRDELIGCEINFGQTTGFLSKRDMLPTDTIGVGDEVTVYLIGVAERDGQPSLNVSRTNDGYVRALLTEEVPEIQDGIVQIRASARQPGVRTKIMLSSNRPDVDPVGACIGEGSVRYRAVLGKLGKETVDLLEWKDDPELRIIEALKPAKILGIYVNPENDREAFAICNNDDKKVAVGRAGSNVRLAGRICGQEIQVIQIDEALGRKIPYKPVSRIEEEARVRAEELARQRLEEERLAREEAGITEEYEAEIESVGAAAPQVSPAVESTPTHEASVTVEASPVEKIPVSAVRESEPTATPAAIESKTEEVPLEHVTITGRARVSLSALEEQVERERNRKTTSRPNWKKRKTEDKKDSKVESKTATPVQNAMPIYTEEELEEIEREEYDTSYDYDSDLDEYDDDSYYDEN